MAVFRLLCVMTLLVAATVAVEVDQSKPQKKMVKPVIFGSRHFTKKHVVIVPKGDPRAYPPAGFAATAAPSAATSFGYEPATPEAAAVAEVNKPGLLKATAPGAGCTNIRGVCIAKSACTGSSSITYGLCPGATYCCVPAAPVPSGGIGSALASAANAVCTNYRSVGTKYNQANRAFGLNVRYSDCSSFTQTVFEQAGYGSIFGRANAQTQAMRNVIARRGGGYHKNAQLGDVVMWASGSTGHVGIITKLCTSTTFQLTAMGGKGCGPYPAGGGCMTWQQMTAYGLGGANGFLGYWTAR